MSQLTVQNGNGAKLLPDVPKGTGGTKSKSKLSNYHINTVATYF